MAREITGKGIRFSLRHAPCAHICRYCLISESRKRGGVSFDRFEALLNRFYDWQQNEKRDDLWFGTFVGPSFDYDIETVKGIARLRAKRGDKLETVNLGGLRLRSREEIDVWLSERKAAGVDGVHASLAGYGEMHDKWNGRKGDFDYQLSILTEAARLGMTRDEKLFLTMNTLPAFDRLLDALDALPGQVRRRTVGPFFYAGLARRSESERITEDIRDNLPERISRLRSKRFDTWRSEREWIPIMLETADQPRRLMLKLDVNEGNIDRLETLPCEQIFAEVEREYQQSYRQIPALDDLCDRYGDRSSTKIYVMCRDVEGRWLDMHQRETGIPPPLD